MRGTRLQTVLALAAAVGVTACADPTTIDEHFEVDGFAIYEGTDPLYVFTLDEGDPSPLTLEQRAYDVRIVLLGPDGAPITEDDHDEEHDEHELEIFVGDGSILTWTPEPADDDNGVHDFVEFHGELNALQAGSTTLELCVPHDATHCDFEEEVPVTVLAP